MHRGLYQKVARESAAITVILGLAFFGVELLFARIIPAFYQDLSEHMLRLPFVRNMVATSLQIDPSQVGPAVLMGLVWVHPVVLILVCAHAIWAGTRVPAAEIERGTVDFLLAMPVSRFQVALVELICSSVCAAFIVALGLLGNIVGGSLLETDALGSIGDRLLVVLNLWSLHLSVFALAFLTSSCSDRRGRASMFAIAVMVACFVLGFLSAYSPLIKKFLFLSLLNYYRPLVVLQGGGVAMGDILVLLGIGALLSIVGFAIFSHRDIRTV